MEKKNVRILLVDDESGFTDVLSKRMSRRGLEVVAAESGCEAIRILRKEDFDAAVLDLKMEDMDGFEVLKVLKQLVPEMPVIMLTGHGSEAAAKDGMRLGAFDYLLKPCDLDKLIAKIRKAVGR